MLRKFWRTTLQNEDKIWRLLHQPVQMTPQYMAEDASLFGWICRVYWVLLVSKYWIGCQNNSTTDIRTHFPKNMVGTFCSAFFLKRYLR